jgi:DNA-directed RNA polymerase specialized sigma24 family protein
VVPLTVGPVNADLSDRAELSIPPLRTEPVRPSGEAGDGWGRSAAYDAYADGLHTYAIWSLRDHDAAADALYCTFVIADRNITQLRQPEQIQPWLYAILRRECMLRMAGSGTGVGGAPASASTSVPTSSPASTSAAAPAPSPVSGRLRPPSGASDPGGSLASLERSLRRAEFHSLEWPESEGLAPAHKEILELTIRHGLDSQGLGLVLGLGQPARLSGGGSVTSTSALGSVGSQGFGVLADAWRELERSLAAVAVAKGSREHCAQLAELTFGWSGRLNATLRAPLTDHVDGCTRCQHYLHTVVGTPAAPTILPFVAAPRALREILLDELHDPEIAVRLGNDHSAIAARVQRFAPNGFPAFAEPTPMRRRGGRRAAPKGTAPGRITSTSVRTPVADAQSRPAAHRGAPESVPQPAESTAETLPRRTPGTRRPSVGDAGDSGVYRKPGSWAARVLPADAVDEWRPVVDEPPSQPRSRIARPPRRNVAAARVTGRADEQPSFISTPSGRFAFRAPGSFTASSPTAATEMLPAVSGTAVAGTPGAAGAPGADAPTRSIPSVGHSAPPTAPMSRFSAPAPETPRGRDGRPRARHKSRPVRQAVLSAVALGTVGAAAAASAALLGLVSENHTSQVLDAAPSQDPISTLGRSGGLTVTVSSPATPAATGGGHNGSSLGAGGHGTGSGSFGSGFGSGSGSGVSGAIGTGSGSGAGAAGGGKGTSSGSGASAADFHVSVNQRAADPNSVTILLRNSGTAPIAWSARPAASWIVLSQGSGTLGAGQSAAVVATATGAAPAGAWTSTVTFAPGGTVVTLHGGSAGTPPASSAPPTTAPPSTPPTSSAPTPTPTPSASSPTASGPSPSAEGPSASHSASAQPSTQPSASASFPVGRHRRH